MISTIIDAMSTWNWTAIAAVSSAVMAIFTGLSLLHNFKTQQLTVSALRDEMADRKRLAAKQARKVTIRSRASTYRQNFRTGAEDSQFGSYLTVEVTNKSDDTIDHVDIELPSDPILPATIPIRQVARNGSFNQRMESMSPARQPTLTYCSELDEDPDPVRAVSPHSRRLFALPDLRPGQRVDLDVCVAGPRPSEKAEAKVKFTTANSRRYRQGSDGEPEEIG